MTPRQEPQTPTRDWLLALATALHTTLDVEELIAQFSERIVPVVPHDCVEFRDNQGTLRAAFGEPQAHDCRYDMVLIDDPLGTLVLSRDEPFDEAETVVLETLVANLAHPLRNALLYQDALQAAARDPLTGVSNRGGLEGMLEREIGLARRHATPLSVIMLDLDRFKTINDTYGHLVGDCALKGVASVIQSCVRDSDLVFRYGGEEFAILLANTDAAGAALLGERIRGALANQPIRCHELSLDLTLSLGVAEMRQDDDAGSLLRRADQALYRAKTAGRNRVSVADGDAGPVDAA